MRLTAALALLFGLAFISPLAVHATTRATQTIFYTPFSGNHIAKNLIVDSEVSGSCWEGSMASGGRADAWRCMTGNDIHDPCYTSTSKGREVVCGDPLSQHVTVIKLTSPLPTSLANQGSGTRDLPSALELGDGTRCGMITGASDVVDGMRLNYACIGDMDSVYGDPDRSASPWAVHVRSKGSAALHRVNVRIAWF